MGKSHRIGRNQDQAPAQVDKQDLVAGVRRVPERARSLSGFNEAILSLYAVA